MDALLSAFTCGRSESIFSRPTEEERHIHELETLLTAFQKAYEDLRLAYEAAKAELCLYQQIFGPLDAVHVELVRHLRAENPDSWAEASSTLASPPSALTTLGSSLQKSLRQNGLAGGLAKSALRAVPESAPIDHCTESGPGTSSPSTSPRRPRKGRTMSWARQLQLDGAIKEESPLFETAAEYTPEKIAKNGPEDVTMRDISTEKIGKVVLSPRASHERERVMRALEDIKERAKDGMLCKLNAFQLQCVRDQARVRVFRAGEVLIHKGVQATAAMHVLLSGSVHFREVDCNLVLPDFSFVGHASALFGESPTTIAAVGDVETLMLSKGLLECMFGQRLKDVLLRSFIFSALARHEVFTTLSAEELKAAADICEVVCLEPNEELDITNLRLALCMLGEVTTSVGNNGEAKKCVSKGSMVELIGEECLLNSDRPWARQVVATSDARAVLGVWRGPALTDLLNRALANGGTDEQEVITSSRAAA